MKKAFLFIAVLVFGSSLFGQKKEVKPADYFLWNTISSYQIGHTGNIIVYEITRLKHDGFLVIYNKKKNSKDTIPRGTRAKINSGENYVVFKIKPEYDSVRQMKIDKVKKSKFPKDSLGIFLVEQDSLIKVPKLKSFYLPEEGEWIAYLLDHNKKIDPPGKKKKKKKKKKKDEPKIESKGKRLVFFNPIEGIKEEFENVKSVYKGRSDYMFAYVIQQKQDTLDSNYVHVFNTKTLESNRIFSSVKSSTIRFNYETTELAFFGTQDTSKVKVYNLYHWKKNQETKVLIDTNNTQLPKDFSVSDNSNISFSRDGSKIYFGIWEIKREEPKDTIPKNEKFKVDIWHYQDKRVQPNQLLSAKKDAKKHYRSVLNLETETIIRLEDDEIKSGYILDHGNSDWYYASSKSKYEGSYSWDFPWRKDVYLINTNTGDKKLVAEAVGFELSISPSGEYLVYWNYDNYKAYFYSVKTGKTIEVKAEGYDLVEKGNGIPARNGSYGVAGWTKDENLILYSKKDILIYNKETNKVNPITRVLNIKTFNDDEELRLIKLDRDSSFYDLNRCMIRGFNKKNKNTSLYNIQDGKYEKLLESAHSYTNPRKAKKADVLLFRRSTYNESKDIYYTKDFKDIERVTDINPQQKDYNWANIELVEWVTGNKDTLQGLLYTPENLDKTKKYPMLVYFYEEYSDRYHAYYQPKPTASIIYPVEYASNGYVVFIPDVKYEVGHPAKSAYDCIVSGTDSMIARYSFIDSNKLGLQGQSWGGYQTAQLVTMTNKYAAGMAGAPVSNMFSAYGGIRWGSGLSREFQYEKTQSRIGATIWERPDLYTENSPIFHLPKVNTPLLIMHNDGDGAVPWYQGIEMFMGLRRLQKPAWLLNYNGDQHNLMKPANRLDLSIRMKQFFDHYLQGKPMPEWLEKGLPAAKKGKITAY